jgi:hypothetical protein
MKFDNAGFSIIYLFISIFVKINVELEDVHKLRACKSVEEAIFVMYRQCNKIKFMFVLK